ncbi:MAG: VOC family protein [Chloroflexi bacterium]|nr:VOC family protein [Chloroflexota bacterium]
MLEHVDRMQLAVRDRHAAAQSFASIFDAQPVRDDEVRHLNAKRRVVHAGTSEFELLEPAGDGPVADYVSQWGEGLFGAGFSTNDVQALARRLSSKGAVYTEEGGQLFIAPDQTPGLRMVISQEVARPMVGLMRYLYEATNLINDHEAAAGFYADRFGLDQSRFCPIKSHDYGYKGQLTMFNPPERLDRIELSEITDPQMPMGRFMTRRGGETLYMCYIECESVDPIAQRLSALGLRFTRGGENSHNPDNMFIHPTALHGVLMGCSRTNAAWVWSGHPELFKRG